MKKKIVSICLVLALLAVGAVGMYAYFVATTETAVNAFTVGNVQMTLDETDVDEYGDADATPATRSDDGNTYKLIPGHTYTKDPQVHITDGSEPCFVRMLVEVDDISKLKAAIPYNADNANFYADDHTTFLLQELVDGWDKTTWTVDPTWAVETTGNKVVYEFRYKNVVDARDGAQDLEKLFTSFTIPSDLDNEHVAYLNTLNISITGQAIQEDGFKDVTKTYAQNAADAWAAFDAQE